MKLRLPTRSLTPFFAVWLALACGNADPSKKPSSSDGGAGGEPPSGPLLPWAVGNSWTYQVTKNGDVSSKTTTIGELEAVGGAGPESERMANHVTTGKGDNDHTESWQGQSDDEPERIVRYRELSFDATSGDLSTDTYWEPSKLHVDGSAEHCVTDASWLEEYSETKLPVGQTPSTHDVRERWTVLDDDETLTVPAGTFAHTIHLQRVGSSSAKEYWYLRGVGKLKELGSQTEELSDYSLSSP